MKVDEAVNKESGMVTLQYPNTPLSQILLIYEDLTGLKIIRDANAEQATVSIETTGELTKERAIMYIEKSLLLNGYSFVPAGEGMVKLLSFDAKKPSTEGAPLIESASELPETDQVVSFVAMLKYLSGEDAIKAIDQVIPRHSYGVITAVPNAKALVITENSATIRAMLLLLERLDNKPALTTSKTFQLIRADAEDVKKALDEILGTEDKSSGSSGSSTGGSRNRAVPTAQPNTPGVPAQPSAAGQNFASGGSSEAIAPKIHAIARRNCLLVIATPETMEVIGTLILELDGASEIQNFVSRTLNYLGVDAAMGIISDAISRGEGDGGGDSGVNSLGGQGGVGGTNNQGSTNANSRANTFGSNNTTGGMNNGMSGGLGGGGTGGVGGLSSGGSSGAAANLQPLRSDTGPRSMVVGKTLLISDPTANSLFASGPPEHLRVLNEILDELDRRPQQILISVVIGEMNLSHGNGLSVDTILRGALIRNNGSATAAGGLRGSAASLLDPRNVRSMADFGVDAANAIAGRGLTLYGGVADGVDIIVKTLETNGDFKVLSRPTIFTMNNKAATITSGVSIPVATSTQGLLSGGTSSTGLISNVQYQPVVLSLQILPLINSENELTLQISQENNEASETKTAIAGNEYPELSQQTLDTTVLVKNRSTVLLGGLIRESKNKTKSGLPFLSRIPLLGALTGSQTISTSRRELLIFIQPRIIHGMSDLPPTVEDAPGTSPFAGEVADLLIKEKSSIAKTQPPVTRRTALNRLFRKLFSTDPDLSLDKPTTPMVPAAEYPVAIPVR
jgi:type II secretion system protein D